MNNLQAEKNAIDETRMESIAMFISAVAAIERLPVETSKALCAKIRFDRIKLIERECIQLGAREFKSTRDVLEFIAPMLYALWRKPNDVVDLMLIADYSVRQAKGLI